MADVINHDRPPEFRADLDEMFELRERELGLGRDALDDEAVHHIALSGGLVVAAGRSRPDGVEPGVWLAEHIVVKSDFENPAQAQRTIIRGLEGSVAQRGGQSLELKVSRNQLDGYRSLGFVAVSSGRNRQYVDVHKNIGVSE